MAQTTNLISFSVWGNSPKYLNGCIENIKLIDEIYPGWIPRFYCDSDVDASFMDLLRKLNAEVLVMKSIKSKWEGLFWRFLPASEKGIDTVIFRDIDSRINEREKVAVDEWLESGKPLHCMRDHMEHNVPMLGGMWGVRAGLIENIGLKMNTWGKYDYKGSDQDFLKEYVWERFKDKAIVHDKFNNGFVVEQVVGNLEEYHKQRTEQSEYREKTLKGKEEYIANAHIQGLTIPQSVLDELFPEIPEVPPIKKNDKGQIVFDYKYDPIKFFGVHDVRPFPSHPPMKHGSHVGEIIE